jgi:hypothetical protein
MAIQKSKTLANGASGNYWRIEHLIVDRRAGKVLGDLALFKDQSTAQSGAPHLGLVKRFTFDLNMVELLAAPNVVTYMYSKIMQKAEELRTHDLLGHALAEPVVTDPDIAGGESI